MHAITGVFGPGYSGNGPYALMFRNLERQAETLSYIDCFWVLGVGFAVLIPLVFLIKKSTPGRGAAAH